MDNTQVATAKTAQETKRLVVLGNRILACENILDSYGHVSMRNPENPTTFFQSRSLSPECVTIDDILEIDFEGNIITKTGNSPYSERFIHSGIYRVREDVQAITHNHALPVIALSVADIPIQVVFHMGGIFYDGVPYYDAYDVSNGTLAITQDEGKRIARRLGNNRACVMRGHGAVVTGEGMSQCVLGAIYLRGNCLVQMQALSLSPTIRPLSKEMAYRAGQLVFSKNSLQRGWDYFVARAKKTMPDIADL